VTTAAQQRKNTGACQRRRREIVWTSIAWFSIVFLHLLPTGTAKASRWMWEKAESGKHVG
jgi:hypothetical protein